MRGPVQVNLKFVDNATKPLSDAERYILAHQLINASARRNDWVSAELDRELQWDPEWLAENCLGDGMFKHPLLAGPEGWREQCVAIDMSGLVVDNRGVHSEATWGVQRTRAGDLHHLRDGRSLAGGA